MLQSHHYFHPEEMERQETWLFNSSGSSATTTSEGSFPAWNTINFHNSDLVDMLSPDDTQSSGFKLWSWSSSSNVSSSLEMQRQKQGQRERDFCCNDKREKKKQCHNAYERDRRKRVNALYQKLDALLPPCQSKSFQKQNNPAILLRALKYIPSLQKEFSFLQRRRDEMLKISRKSESQANTESSQEKIVSEKHQAIVTVCVADKEIMITVGIASKAKSPFHFGLIIFLQQRNVDVITASMVVSDDITWSTIHIHNAEKSADKIDLELEITRFFEEQAIAEPDVDAKEYNANDNG